MSRLLSQPLDDDELAQLDDFLLNRLDDDTSDRIAAVGGDEGILDVSELDGLLTAIVSGPNVVLPSRWGPALWGMEEYTWDSVDQAQRILNLILRHQNSIADLLIHDPRSFEPMFLEREADGKTYVIVDEWCFGYMRGVTLDAKAWEVPDTVDALQAIRLWGTEEGWKQLESLGESEQEVARQAIAPAARALHRFWLERRTLPAVGPRRASPKVGRNEPCPCGSGKKSKHCCLQ